MSPMVGNLHSSAGVNDFAFSLICLGLDPISRCKGHVFHFGLLRNLIRRGRPQDRGTVVSSLDELLVILVVEDVSTVFLVRRSCILLASSYVASVHASLRLVVLEGTDSGSVIDELLWAGEPARVMSILDRFLVRALTLATLSGHLFATGRSCLLLVDFHCTHSRYAYLLACNF